MFSDSSTEQPQTHNCCIKQLKKLGQQRPAVGGHPGHRAEECFSEALCSTGFGSIHIVMKIQTEMFRSMMKQGMWER